MVTKTKSQPSCYRWKIASTIPDAIDVDFDKLRACIEERTEFREDEKILVVKKWTTPVDRLSIRCSISGYMYRHDKRSVIFLYPHPTKRAWLAELSNEGRFAGLSLVSVLAEYQHIFMADPFSVEFMPGVPLRTALKLLKNRVLSQLEEKVS